LKNLDIQEEPEIDIAISDTLSIERIRVGIYFIII